MPTNLPDPEGRARRHPQTALIAAGRPADEPGQPLNVPIIMASNFRAAQLVPDWRPGVHPRPRHPCLGGAGRPIGASWRAAKRWLRLGNGGRGGGPRPRARGCSRGGADRLLHGSPRPAGRRPAAGTLGGPSWSTSRTRPPPRPRPAARTWCGWSRPRTRCSTSPTCGPCASAARCGRSAWSRVDNTFATPLLQQPLRLGARIAMHSATKFFGGHSDLLLGIAVGGEQPRGGRAAPPPGMAGAIPGALETFLVLRGLRTLWLRLEQGPAQCGRTGPAGWRTIPRSPGCGIPAWPVTPATRWPPRR